MSAVDIGVAVFLILFIVFGLGASLYVDKIHREHHEKERDLPKK